MYLEFRLDTMIGSRTLKCYRQKRTDFTLFVINKRNLTTEESVRMIIGQKKKKFVQARNLCWQTLNFNFFLSRQARDKM